MSLTGRVALVTGGGRGLGRAIALRLARDGAGLAIAGLEDEPLEDTASVLRGMGADAVPVQADLSHPDQVQGMAQQMLDHFGKVDILVNNAGFNQRRHHFVDIDLASWQEVVSGNLTAAFVTSHAVAPGMMERRWGRIVNISAIQAWKPLPGNAAYAAAKAGLMGLTRSLAVDLSPYGIIVNSIAPGPVDSRAQDDGSPCPGDDKWPTLVGRRGLPREVADLTAFLVSEECSFLTGHVIPCDGGRLISRRADVE